MNKETENASDRHTLSRRDILVGAAATTLIATAPGAAAAYRRKGSLAPPPAPMANAPLRRYMAASAMLGDGRVLITGGYDRPWSDSGPPSALSSAMILDPGSGQLVGVAPMSVPRARHAAVALPDGRVAVLGGVGNRATASVEIYDPRTDSWQVGESLDQPRYDHTAVSDGQNVYILGGSSQSMVSGIEVYRPQRLSTTSPTP
ncbi:Kelch repeat-containing protein [Fimbriimonas ginsengisoli]|uniref:Putative Ig n=1 Tax=Fimbriimonas ginsengisoli Gsoil 348 TaxID=661478 RepID=A0A068NWT4_FIMGI|nr:kelch repeat-containing protein [Fimbriimonas ginsengisoli]AIE87906.1 putative Ig [Fimbriimonas ginsengisoli Gsoil 348]